MKCQVNPLTFYNQSEDNNQCLHEISMTISTDNIFICIKKLHSVSDLQDLVIQQSVTLLGTLVNLKNKYILKEKVRENKKTPFSMPGLYSFISLAPQLLIMESIIFLYINYTTAAFYVYIFIYLFICGFLYNFIYILFLLLAFIIAFCVDSERKEFLTYFI